MGIVVKARRTEKGTIIHELDNGQEKEYWDVRGGISWLVMAETYLPCYYCILGEEHVATTHFKGQEPQRGKLTFLNEYEETDILALDKFYAMVSHDVIRYGCATLYAVTEKFQGEDYSGYAQALRKDMYKKGAASSLQEAPYADKPDLGLYHINLWRKKGLLELPERSIARGQLEMVTTDIVNQLPQRLNAVNALRFVVSSFELSPPVPSQDWRKKAGRKGSWLTA